MKYLLLILSLASIVLPSAAQSSAVGQKTQGSKAWNPPLTSDGQPDLQGVWENNMATPLERPKKLEGRQSLTDAEVAELKKRADRIFASGDADAAGGDAYFLAALENPEHFKNPGATGTQIRAREFDNRTSLIIDPPDGKIPPMTEAARRRQSAEAVALAAGVRPPSRPQDLNAALRCITYGVPRLGGNYGSGNFGFYEIVQSHGYVVFYMEQIHEARIIPLDGRPHLPQNIRSWEGDSRGHWEGKTLVVDTTNFAPQTNFLGSRENLHLVERFTRVAHDEIRYEITVDDPTTWVRPWTAMIRLKHSDDKVYETACHEDNRSLEGILAGARAADAAEKR